jgi:hypothetical protein
MKTDEFHWMPVAATSLSAAAGIRALAPRSAPLSTELVLGIA